MRITQRILNNNMLFALQQNLSGIQKLQEHIERGTKINRPSDDPSGFSQTLALQSNLNLNGQYQRNITNGLAWLLETDSALNSSVETLALVRTGAIQAANDALTLEDRDAVARAVDAMLDQLVVYANTSLGNTYIFGGLKNTFPPFFRYGDSFVFAGDDQSVLRDIAPEGRFSVNASGKASFYDKLNNLVKGAGSKVNTVEITNEQHFVKSFGGLTDADLAAKPLNGKMVLNLDGKDYQVIFTNENTVAGAVATINDALGLNGQAYLDPDGTGRLVIESNSVNLSPFISVVAVDAGLAGLKLVAGFNNLQFGKYQVSTVNGANAGTGTSAADSRALVTDSFSQSNSTIVTGVGVVDPQNALNSSVLMEVIEVNYTNNKAEVISAGPINLNPGDLADGSRLTLELDTDEYTVIFNGVNSNADLVHQINAALGFNGVYLDGDNNLIVRSTSSGSSSRVVVKELSPGVDTALGLYQGQSGGVGVTDATVRFTYHTYDKQGNRYDGTVEYTYYDTEYTELTPEGDLYHPKDGIPDCLAATPPYPYALPQITIGDGAQAFELYLNLTGFVQVGDRAVLSVTAQGVVADDSINVNYDGKNRKYVLDNGVAAADGVSMKFFSLDEGNGEIYDGNIDLTFNGAISDALNAASFTAGNVFDSLVYLRKKIENEEQNKIEQMEAFMDEFINVFLQQEVKVGARTNQFEAVDENYRFLEVNLSKMLADYYITDPYKTLVKLEESMATFKSSLYSSSLIMQAKFLDFIR